MRGRDSSEEEDRRRLKDEDHASSAIERTASALVIAAIVEIDVLRSAAAGLDAVLVADDAAVLALVEIGLVAVAVVAGPAVDWVMT